MDALALLGERLQRRGPVAAALVAYLSCRVDLLTEAEVLELAAIAGTATATPDPSFEEQFRAASGRRLDEAFASFDNEPFATGLLCRWHRARLGNGDRVVVKIVHPEAETLLEPELDAFPELSSILGRSSQPERERAFADFRDFFGRALDLRREAGDLIDLGERCQAMSLVTVPEVHLELSGERFLTLADVRGSTAAERARLPAARAEDSGARLARRLCRAWLRLVLSAATVPVDPRGRNVLFLEDGKVAFCGGPFEPLSGRARDLLRDYLAAATIADHESCADAFLDLSDRRTRLEERRLRHQLRHTAPFRDGGWNPVSDSLASVLLAQWHRATALGFRSRPPLRAFLSGLTLLTREAGIVAPGADSFREAFQELRLYQLFAESARLADGDGAAPIADLPRKLDRGLTLAAAESRSGREPPTDSHGGSWSAVLALLMALAAVVLLVHHIAPGTGVPVWVERLGAVAVLILGGLLLRFAAD